MLASAMPPAEDASDQTARINELEHADALPDVFVIPDSAPDAIKPGVVDLSFKKHSLDPQGDADFGMPEEFKCDPDAPETQVLSPEKTKPADSAGHDDDPPSGQKDPLSERDMWAISAYKEHHNLESASLDAVAASRALSSCARVCVCACAGCVLTIVAHASTGAETHIQPNTSMPEQFLRS